jgi:hypothetical protein
MYKSALLLLFAFTQIVCPLRSTAAELKWTQLEEQGNNCLAQKLCPLAFNKFRAAWIAVGDPTLTNPEYVKLREELESCILQDQTISPETTFAKFYHSAPIKELDQHLRDVRRVSCYDDWTVALTKHGDLSFSAPRSTFVSQFNYCGNAYEALSKMPVEQQREFKQRTEELLRLGHELPAKLSALDPRFQSALEEAQPIAKGQTKSVSFNLNPYIDRKYWKIVTYF